MNAHNQQLEPFQILEHGRLADGRPYVLPHDSGDRAYGLLPGWYFWDSPIAPCAEPEGPFSSEFEAQRAIDMTAPLRDAKDATR